MSYLPLTKHQLDWQERARDIASPIGTRIEEARALMLSAAIVFDEGRSGDELPYVQTKVNCSEAPVRTTSDLMTCFTGTAFARRSPIERYFRVARAGLVMRMATDVAYQAMVPLMFTDNEHTVPMYPLRNGMNSRPYTDCSTQQMKPPNNVHDEALV